MYDVIIIGSGPAGLTAGIYTSRDNLKTLMFAGGRWGGQLMLTTTVDNFPGFPEGVEGPDFMSNMKKQAERFGVEVKLEEATNFDFKGPTLKVNGVETRSVIVATGADTVWLGVTGEEKLIGRGVSSCAPCDAFFFKGKKVIVVGGGDAAMEEAITLAKFASEVTIVHRRDQFRATKVMQDRALSAPNVKTLFNTEVVEVSGTEKVTGVKFKDGKEFMCDGVFVAIGHSPNTKLFEGQLELDDKGFIIKKEGMMTSVNGVFVAGDVHDHHYKQAITAAGFGCQAAMEVIKFLC